MARDERPWSEAYPPGVVHEDPPGRSGEHGENLLDGFRGTVQVDGHGGHNRLARPNRPGGALTRAACWVHAIEKKIRGKPPATRQFVRWTGSAPLVNAFGLWLAEQCSCVSPRSRPGEKLACLANQWDGLLVFLHDGRVERDSNFVENRIRPVKCTAKNALFAGHDEGARSWGRIASRIDELLPWNFVPPSR